MPDDTHTCTITSDDTRALAYELDTDDAITAFIERFDDPVVTTSDVAEAFDITRNAARYRLADLVEQGRVTRRPVGASAVVYWVAD